MPIRLAVIGTGHLGRIHARLATDIRAFELVAIADPSESARRELSSELGVTAMAGHSELIGQIDAAVVAAPTRVHHDVVRDLLQSGADVLVEKPISATTAEAKALVQCAAEHQRILQVGHVERFNPALAAARPHIADPKFIDARRFSGYSFRSTDIGVVLDMMIHDVDLILSMVGELPCRVTALGAGLMGGHEDMAHARLEFPGGCVAQLSACRVSDQATRQMQVWCPTAFVGIDFGAGTARVIRAGDSLRRGVAPAEAMTPAEKLRAKDRLFDDYLTVDAIVPDARNALADELSEFAASIQTRVPPQVTGAIARDAVAVSEAILANIREHRWDGRADGRVGPDGAIGRKTASIVPWPDAAPDRRRAG